MRHTIREQINLTKVNFYRNSQNKHNLRSLSRKKTRNVLGAVTSMSHWHILLLFQVVALLTIYSEKYPYKITISYPNNLHFHVHPPLFSLSLYLSHISKLTSCNCSPLINTRMSVMIFTHFSINLAMPIHWFGVTYHLVRYNIRVITGVKHHLVSLKKR